MVPNQSKGFCRTRTRLENEFLKYHFKINQVFHSFFPRVTISFSIFIEMKMFQASNELDDIKPTLETGGTIGLNDEIFLIS